MQKDAPGEFAGFVEAETRELAAYLEKYHQMSPSIRKRMEEAFQALEKRRERFLAWKNAPTPVEDDPEEIRQLLEKQFSKDI